MRGGSSKVGLRLFSLGPVIGHFEQSEIGRNAKSVENENEEKCTEGEKDDLYAVPEEVCAQQSST